MDYFGLVLENTVNWLLILFLTLVFTMSVIFVYYHIDHYDPEPKSNLVKVFAYGVITPIFTVPFYFLLHNLLVPVYDDASLTFIDLVLIAPIIEELFKALLLVQVLKQIDIDGPMDGMLYGICLGAGFSTIENVIYGISALSKSGLLHALQLTLVRGGYAFIGHPIYSGIFGWGLGAFKVKLRRSKYTELPVSILLHMLWNAIFIIPSLISITRLLWFGIIIIVIASTGAEMYRRLKIARKIDDKLHQQGYFDNKREYRVI